MSELMQWIFEQMKWKFQWKYRMDFSVQEHVNYILGLDLWVLLLIYFK